MAGLEGREIGRYHLVEQIGQGGMATVYKAYDTRLERTVAIKIIRTTAFPADIIDQVLKRFEREAKALAKMSHPNIVKVYDYGEYENAPYLVMEYLKGGTLKNRFEGAIPWAQATRLLTPIARALAYAHQMNILHRDVKPGNILITESGEAMLSDFGIAKILDAGDGQTLTGAGVGIGTPEYMAPEQAVGQASPQSDIYALGVVLYELITGHRPFTADTPMAVLIKHMTDPLPLPTMFVPELPEAMEMAMLKALAKEPEERYGDMSEFAATLDRLTSGAVTEAAIRIDKEKLQIKPDAKKEEEPPVQVAAEVTQVVEGETELPVLAQGDETMIDEQTRASLGLDEQVTEIASPPSARPVSETAPTAQAPEDAHRPATAPVEKKKGLPWLAVAGAALVVALIAFGALVLPGLLARPTPVVKPPASPTSAPPVEQRPPAAAAQPTPLPTEPVRADAPPSEPQVIVIWHNYNPEQEANYRRMFDVFQHEHPGLVVELVHKENLIDAARTQIPAGRGPDLVLGQTHDMIGMAAEQELIVPLDDLGVSRISLNAQYMPTIINAVSWQNHYWALPLEVEAIALVYNRDVVPERFLPSDPDDFGALLEKAQMFFAETGKPLICSQGFSGVDAYHVAPIYLGFGTPGYATGEGEAFINSPSMLAAGEWLAELRKVSLPDNSFDICLRQFTAGQVGMWWTGPWALPFIEESRTPYGVFPMGRPFIGVKTVMVTRNAIERQRADLAVALARWIAGPDAQRELFQSNRTIPSITDLVRSPEFEAMQPLPEFAAAARRGVPMLNAPFAPLVWEPVSEATGQIWSGTLNPKEALGRAQIKILAVLKNK